MVTTLAYVFLVTLFSGFLQTLTGFGYALAAAPLLALAMNPKEVVMFVLFTGALIKAVLIYRTRGIGGFRQVMPFFLASIAGAVPGAVILTIISNEMLKILIGLVLVIVSWVMYRNISIDIKQHTIAKAVAGFTSGFLGSTTSLNGPPLVLYYMNEKEEKEVIRANLARYFLLGNMASLAIAWGFGNLHLANLAVNAAVSIPALLFGFWLGDRVFDKVDADMFRRLALVVITASGMITIGSGFWHYWH